MMKNQAVRMSTESLEAKNDSNNRMIFEQNQRMLSNKGKLLHWIFSSAAEALGGRT